MTMQPRTGLFSAMSASRTTAWYQSGKFSARVMLKARCIGSFSTETKTAPPSGGVGGTPRIEQARRARQPAPAQLLALARRRGIDGDEGRDGRLVRARLGRRRDRLARR